MKLSEIKDILDARIAVSGDDPDLEIKVACGCDLMSDVLAFIESGAILLTGLINPQTIRTAEMTDIAAICYVRGKNPPEETINLAKEKGLPVLLTKLPLFEACGRLYNKGLSGLET